MARRVAAGLLTSTVMVALALLVLADAAGERGNDKDNLQYRRHRIHHRRGSPPRTPPAPPAQPIRPAPPAQPIRPVHPAPPPPTQLCNDSFAPEDRLTASGDVCTAVPPAAPPLPPPRAGPRCPPCTCTCPKPPRPFQGWPVPRPLPVPVPGRGGSNAGAGYDCVTTLSPMMMNCASFITSNETETPTTECCSGLGAFVRAASAAAAAGRGDQVLHCLCPYILGDVDKTLKNPVDPVRMMYLPVACRVVMPPQLLPICFTGRPLPEVNNLPQGSERSP